MLAKEVEFVLLDLLRNVLHGGTKKVDLPGVLVLKDNAQKNDDILWDCLHSEHSEYPNSMNPRL